MDQIENLETCEDVKEKAKVFKEEAASWEDDANRENSHPIDEACEEVIIEFDVNKIMIIMTVLIDTLMHDT